MNNNFKIYVSNLGKYNEGELIGEWVNLPTTAEEFAEILERIGINKMYEEWFIPDYDFEVSNLGSSLEFENINALNYLALKIDDFDEWQFETFVAACELESCSSALDMINIAANIDDFNWIDEVFDDRDLGYYYIDELQALEIPDQLRFYIDYEAFGHDVRIEEGGLFVDAGYISRINYSPDELSSIDEIPEEYQIDKYSGKKADV